MTIAVRARGLTFDVVAGGPADGPAVLLLHGFPQHSGEWDAVTPALHAAGLRTYALDQRGYSPGARPTAVDDYRTDECVADALAVLDELGVPSAHVVGHDWGAAVGWTLAARHEERVRTLTAVSVPHPAAMAAAVAQDEDQRKRSEYMLLFRQPEVAETTLLAADGAVLRAVFEGLSPEVAQRYIAPMCEPGALTAALNWYRAMDWTEAAAVPPVRVPTTFVWSDGDAAVGPVAAKNCAAHVTGDYRLVEVAGVSHWVPDEAPEPVAAAILDRVGG